MVLKLYNTLTHSEEVFTPSTDGVVKMYSCGPTVYDYAHIGNWRTFIVNDLLRRVLNFNQYQVNHVMNITDVDDKTINGSRAAGQPLGDFTKKYEQIFLDDLKSLNILPPSTLTHATDFIPQIIDLVQKLLESGHAYVIENDGVYFKITSFADYGKLSGQNVTEKRDDRDFALWKFEMPEDNGNVWEAPFGKGRPGWHIECSAMSMSELGNTLDIHTGGSDLMFPHHENEIAQSESLTGQPFVRFWLHTAFLQVDGHKMSKSLNNFYTLKNLSEHNISPLAYRYWLLTSHYRSQVNFTWEALAAAQTAFNRLEDRIRDLPDGGEVDKNLCEQFLALLNNDLNLPQALAFALSSSANKATWLEFDKVFGLNLLEVKRLTIPVEVQELLNQREQARRTKDWPKADQLRQEIEAKGFEIEDTEAGPRLKPKI